MITPLKCLLSTLFEWDVFFKWTCIPVLKALYSPCHIHPFTHTFIHWWRKLPCKVPTAHQKQFRVQYHAQGHFDMQLNPARGSWDSNQQTDDLLYLLAELQPPQISRSKFPECSRITFSKNITKMFCVNLLKMFSDNIAWTLWPNVPKRQKNQQKLTCAL